MRRFVEPLVDALAGVVAAVWAILALTAAPELRELVSPEVAGPFALAAFGRAYAKARSIGSES